MAPPATKKRRTEDDKPEDVSDPEDAYADAGSSDSEAAGSDDEVANDSSDSDTYAVSKGKKRTRKHDPTAFSTSLSKILGSHLTTSKRSDPILVRAKTNVKTQSENAIEAKAKRLLLLEKKAELEKGRIRDLIPNDATGAKSAIERERRLKKVAQRGVVRLFNAVRAAQVKGEMAEREVEEKGVIAAAEKKQKGMFQSAIG